VTNALRIRRFGKKEKSKSKSFTQVYTIEGMMCMHCKSKVEEIFKTTLGVESVEVDLDKGLAIVKTTKDISKEVISRIENANFKVKSVK
jgi:Cu+-exporting ATPase